VQICRWWYQIHFSLSIQVKGTVSRDEYFFEGLKNQSSTFCRCADGFNLFCILIVRKLLLKFLLASMKTLTNSGDFTGSRTNLRKLSLDLTVWYCSNSQWHMSLLWRLLWGTSIQRLKKATANYLHVSWKVILYASKFLEFSTIISWHWTVYRITGGFMNAATSILKRVSIGIFKIRSKQNV
jgi:hypothetical protein